MFLQGKGYIAQEFYNEYLDLKAEIQTLAQEIEYLKYRKPNAEELLKEKELQFKEKIEHFLFVVKQLNERKVSTEALLLLTMGVGLK